MKIYDGFHMVHYEAVRLEEMTGRVSPREFSGKGSTQKIYLFPNGYGASVINGFMSYFHDELGVLHFPNEFKWIRSKKKRFKKKLSKRAGQYTLTYDTPVTCDVERYSDKAELNKTLIAISKLKA